MKNDNKLKYDQKYRYNLYSTFHNALFETRHIVTEFNNVAKYIAGNILCFDEKHNIDQYTGWNWHIANKNCSFDNNINSGYPIFINVADNLSDDTFAYVVKRDLYANKIVIKFNSNNVYDKEIETELNHEFTHIRTMYSRFFIDPLDSKKHKYDIENIVYYYNVNNRQYSFEYFAGSCERYLFNANYFKIAANVLYLMSQTEQEARINQAYKYIINKYDSANLPSKKEIIQNIDNITLMQSFINEYDNLLASLEDYRFLNRLLCVAYYMNEYGYVNFDILSKELMLEYFNIFHKPNNDQSDILIYSLNKCVDTFYDNMIKYQHKLYNIIDDAIYDIKIGQFK